MQSLVSRVLTITALATLAAPAFAQVTNDDCSSAAVVIDGANGPFSNVGATASAVPAFSCGFGAGANDVWFLYIASCTGAATATTCGGGFDTVVEAYDGGCGGCSALVSSGCNDDSCGLQSSVTFATTAGGAYFIRVGGYAGNSGSFPLNLSCTPSSGGGPADDEIGGAGLVNLGLNGPFSNVGYTTSAPSWPCALGGNDRWFLFVATCTAPHTFRTCSTGTTYDTCIQVFSGAPPCSLVDEGCNDDFCGLQSSITVNCVPGLYYVRVGGFNGLTGSFDLTIETGTGAGSIVPAGGGTSSCAFGLTLSTTGNPNIGNSVTATLSGITAGIPIIAYDFPIIGHPPAHFPLGAPCSCSIVDFLTPSGGSYFLFSPTQVLPIPCNVVFIGLQVHLQGLEAFLTPSGRCAFVPGIELAASDVDLITIG